LFNSHRNQQPSRLMVRGPPDIVVILCVAASVI
jgi:hypothetical protein